MQEIATLLWDPFLVLLYLVLGVWFTVVTGAIVWTRGARAFRTVWSGSARATSEGDIPHREAFLSALAASVGVGNLAGVATALHLGGPGALFWMWVSALFGMCFRLCSTYLAIKHGASASATSVATPMLYLERFLPPSCARVPQAVAVLLIAVGLINANLIQSNSIAHALRHSLGLSNLVIGACLTAAVGLVILGGVRTVVRVSTWLTPWMLGAYVLTGLLVLASQPAATLRSLESVFYYAWQPCSLAAGTGGYVLLRSMQYGVSRGVFSHGSGIGMAPFFQGSNTDHPAHGAFMSAAVPLFDTLVVCTITGLVILSNGFWQFLTSAQLTVSAFTSAAGTPGKVITLACLLVFAFTTMISWAHFSERCFEYLGGRNLRGYRGLFAAIAFVGPLLPVSLVWAVGDIVVGLLLLLHLLPMSYVVLTQLRPMMRDLEMVQPATRPVQRGVS